MNIYYIHCTIGAGMTNTFLEGHESLDEAEISARYECVELAESYGFYQDYEHFQEYDSVGRDFDEESGEYFQEGSLEYFVEYYNPDKHDELL